MQSGQKPWVMSISLLSSEMSKGSQVSTDVCCLWHMQQTDISGRSCVLSLVNKKLSMMTPPYCAGLRQDARGEIPNCFWNVTGRSAISFQKSPAQWAGLVTICSLESPKGSLQNDISQTWIFHESRRTVGRGDVWLTILKHVNHTTDAEQHAVSALPKDEKSSRT